MNHLTENDRDAITQVVQHYIDGAKSGSGEVMKPAFHLDASIFGYIGADLFSGPIQQLFAWNDENGPATELCATVASIDVIGTVATARLELDNWTGHRFTDLFTLLKIDGEWKIINKVFHLHEERLSGHLDESTLQKNFYTPEQMFGLDLIVYPGDPRLPF